MQNDGNPPARPLFDLIDLMIELFDPDSALPSPDTPIGRLTREFFKNNWIEARDGVLSRTTRFRLWPRGDGESPNVFRFEVDTRYKSKPTPSSPVKLLQGPLRGMIRYRPDLYQAPPDEPSILVLVDREHGLYHPNYSRWRGILCTGLEGGPFPLEALIEHVNSILVYANRNPADPADREAARYFMEDPLAMVGLETIEPLY